VDVHCHLGDEAFTNDIEMVLDRALHQNVNSIISSTVSLPEALRSLKISAQHSNLVYTSIGSDPSQLDDKLVRPIIETVRANIARIVGIGEVGLDHYWVTDPNSRNHQLKLFKEWIMLAAELELPLTVHSRSAGYETLETIKSSNLRRVLMHAYDGKVGHAMQAAESGILFSIPTSVVHSEQKQKLVRRLPLENLVLETDSPVLSPIEGQRNEPANLKYSLFKISELKQMDGESVAEITTRNATRFFNLPGVT
jgi:TatD DNase family protein